LGKREHQLNLIKRLLSDREWHSLLDLADEIGESTRKASHLLRQLNVRRRIGLDKFHQPVRWVKKLCWRKRIKG